MPRVINLQTSFNSGVLDPRLAARTDLKHFYQGAAEAVNVQSLPQGGMKRRPGFKYVDSIDTHNATVSAAKARLASFAFNVEQTYLLAFTAGLIAVYKDGELQANVGTAYTESELFELQWTQSADTMIIMHQDHPPAKLVRGSGDDIWTLSDITLTNIPKYEYSQVSTTIPSLLNNSDTTVTVASTTGFPASGFISIDSEIISYSGKTTTTFTGCVRGVNGTMADEHDEDSGVFDTEDVWSTARGWPKSATFYQGRLWFGGSKSRPQTLWGSKTNDFFNFDFGDSLDDEGISVTLDTDQVNAITSVFAGRHLQIFTTGGEFSINNIPVTPAKSAVKRHTLFGSSYIPPSNVDGATLFIDRTGKSVREFLFAYAEDAYSSGTVSLLASHLLNAPVDMASLRGTSSDDANYLYIVNKDGTVAVFNSLRDQEVGGWTQWTTNGQVEAVAVVVEEVYFLVKRVIDGQERRFLEKLDEETFTDSCVTTTLDPAGVTVTGLDHLNGQECRVRADGAVMELYTPENGEIELSRTSGEVEVGLNFNASIKTMPVNQDFQDGPTLTRKKRVVRVIGNFYESLGVSVNGEYMVDRSFGMELGSHVEPFTGVKEMYLLGWTDLAQVSITQVEPGPMTVLGLGVEVEA